MAKKFVLCICMLLLIFALTACQEIPSIQTYYIDWNGDLIAEYDNGSIKNLGSLYDSIANGVNQIEINEDGFYIINGIVTMIKARLAKNYSIDDDGNLIVTYSDNTYENLGKFGEDAINTIESVSISSDGYYVLNGIKTNIKADETYNVQFMTEFSSVPSQTIRKGYKVSRPTIEREGYTLTGWLCNGEEWRFNSDVVSNDMILVAQWKANEYQVSFETGIDETCAAITVTFDDNYTLPALNRVGYSFDGWTYQDNLIIAEKWSISEDCILQAKWTPNQYTITLNANGGTVPETSYLVCYDENYDLPVASNTYGDFLGWFFDGVPITDKNGHSLTAWNYLTDIEVDTPWIIKLSNVEDLQYLYQFRDAQFEMQNAISISGNEWVPVGNDDQPFTGKFDGKGYQISGLTITELHENQKYCGLFGRVKSASISNLSMTGVNINLPVISNSVHVGSVVAYSENSTYENISVEGIISIKNHSSKFESCAGGLIGYSNNEIINNCSNSIYVTAKTIAGGVIGFAEYDYTTDLCLINCKNNGTIIANVASGIVGESWLCMTITKSGNCGNIVGEHYAGGMIGQGTVAVINECFNRGAIKTTSTVANKTFEGAGGMIGALSTIVVNQQGAEASSISNSYNTGDISGYNASGIIGNSADGNIIVQDCYNSGAITGTRFAAGMIGWGYLGATIRECLNVGTINGDLGVYMFTVDSISNQNLIITDCYYNCSTSGLDGIQGERTDDYYTEFFFTTKMFWDSSVWEFHSNSLPTLKWETELSS